MPVDARIQAFAEPNCEEQSAVRLLCRDTAVLTSGRSRSRLVKSRSPFAH